MPDRINVVYAFIAIDKDGSEGIPAFVAENNLVMPLLGADLDRVETLRPIAEDIAVTKNLIITLAKFEHRTDLEIFPASDKETLDAQ
jgi:hypothetical protein